MDWVTQCSTEQHPKNTYLCDREVVRATRFILIIGRTFRETAHSQHASAEIRRDARYGLTGHCAAKSKTPFGMDCLKNNMSVSVWADQPGTERLLRVGNQYCQLRLEYISQQFIIVVSYAILLSCSESSVEPTELLRAL